MGSVALLSCSTNFTSSNKATTCLAVAKEEKSKERQSPDLQELVFNFPSVVFIVFFAKEIMPNVLALELQYTWPLSWSIWQPKFWNWQAMLPETTRRQELSLVTCNLPSAMMKN